MSGECEKCSEHCLDCSCTDWNPYHTPTESIDDDMLAIPEEYWVEKLQPIFNDWSYHLEAGLTQEQRKQFMQEIIDALS